MGNRLRYSVAAGALLAMAINLAPEGRLGHASPRLYASAAVAPLPASAHPGLSGDARRRAVEAIAGLPLHFVRNDGQEAPGVHFVARGAGYSVALRGADALITLSDRAAGRTPRTVALGLDGARSATAVMGLDQMQGHLNIVKGGDPAGWHQGIPAFSRVRYAGVYPGVDLVYYGNQRQLQYDFEVAPGAKPGDIGLDIGGVDRLVLDAEGNLEIHVGGRVLRQHKPFTYQLAGDVRHEVPSRFVLDGSIVKFDIGAYDTTRPLVIDPVIAYSSWFGASGEEGVLDLAVDGDGGIVVYGYSHDSEATLKFPTTPGVVKAARAGDADAYVTKFTAAGNALVFSTLLGGTGDENTNNWYTGGLALDGSGNVYVTGTTRSTDFPTTPGAFDTTRNGTVAGNDDGFYAKLSPAGTLLYGTYIGGANEDVPWGLDLDAAGNVYIVGKTSSQTGNDPSFGGFTLAGDPLDPTYNGSTDGFLLRFDPAGALTYATFLGSTSADAYYRADVRASRTTANVVYVVMDAGNANFPTTVASRYQGFVGGGPDGVLVRLDLSQPAASQMTYGTFFGGNGNDEIGALALDATDHVYVAGSTNSSGASFAGVPTWSGSIAPSGTDAFVARFNTAASGAASLVYGMRLNGFYTDDATDIALDSQNQAWFTVRSGSLAPTPNPAQDFPLKNTLTTTRSGNGQHPVVVQLNAAGNDVLLSSLIGGNSSGAPHVALAINAADEVWVGSSSGGSTTDTTQFYLGLVSPYDATYNGGDADVTLQRIGKQADLTLTKTVDKPYPQVTVLPGDTLVYTIVVSNATGDTVSNVVVNDPMPPQSVFVSCAATNGGVCGGSGQNRTITFPSLAAGQSATITLTARVADSVGPNSVWTNTATIGAGGVTDPNTGNNTGGGGGSGGNGSGGVAPITDPGGDADKDGLPNGWEQQYGLNPLASNPGGGSTNDPNGASGDPDGDGRTNLQEYQEGTHPRGFVITYLAEGATGPFFDTRVAIANPTTTPALVLSRFQKADGTTVPRYEVVPPLSRASIDVEGLAGLGQAEFATLVEADVQVVVDRTMKWDASGYGAHAERGILTRTATTWYLAEGATLGNFNLFYLVQNPNTTAADVEVTFLLPSGSPVVKTYTVPAQSRFNIWVDSITELANAEVSAVVTSTNGVPIIVERAMYLTTPSQTFAAGHESAGVTAPSTNWFLAEGNTGNYFDLFILIANPNNQAATVTARYLLESGAVITKDYQVGPNSRFNIWVDFEDPRLADAAISTTVTSTNGVPIIVERAMWWPGDSSRWFEAHNSPGSTETGVKWAMAEGEVGGASQTETYILIANTSSFPGSARVTLLFADGTAPVSKDYTLNPNSRTNVPVAGEFPAASNKVFGAIVESLGSSPAQIVVERAVYYTGGGVIWAAGTNALATRLQ